MQETIFEKFTLNFLCFTLFNIDFVFNIPDRLITLRASFGHSDSQRSSTFAAQPYLPSYTLGWTSV